MLLYKLKLMTCSDFIEFLMIILTKYVFNVNVRLTEYSVTVESVTLRFYCTDDIINTYYPHRCIMWHFRRKKIEQHFSGSYTVELTLPEIVHHFKIIKRFSKKYGNKGQAFNFKSLSPAHRSGMSEICTLLKLVLVVTAMNAVSERSASALRRVKTYLRSTMSRSRLKNLMLLHVHKQS